MLINLLSKNIWIILCLADAIGSGSLFFINLIVVSSALKRTIKYVKIDLQIYNNVTNGHIYGGKQKNTVKLIQCTESAPLYLPFAMQLYLISAIDYALLQTFGDKNHSFFDSKEIP